MTPQGAVDLHRGHLATRVLVGVGHAGEAAIFFRQARIEHAAEIDLPVEPPVATTTALCARMLSLVPLLSDSDAEDAAGGRCSRDGLRSSGVQASIPRQSSAPRHRVAASARCLRIVALACRWPARRSGSAANPWARHASCAAPSYPPRRPRADPAACPRNNAVRQHELEGRRCNYRRRHE